MSKHTPGPWHFQIDKPKSRKLGRIVQSYPLRHEVISLGQKTSFGLQKVIVSDDAENISEADGRLIAAAPELLEATKTFLETIAALDVAIKPFLKDAVIQGSVFDLRTVKANLQRLIAKAEED